MLQLGGVTSTRGVGKGTNELVTQLTDGFRGHDERIDRHEEKLELILSKVRYTVIFTNIITINALYL